jgi:hypothetical protein
MDSQILWFYEIFGLLVVEWLYGFSVDSSESNFKIASMVRAPDPRVGTGRTPLLLTDMERPLSSHLNPQDKTSAVFTTNNDS